MTHQENLGSNGALKNLLEERSSEVLKWIQELRSTDVSTDTVDAIYDKAMEKFPTHLVMDWDSVSYVDESISSESTLLTASVPLVSSGYLLGFIPSSYALDGYSGTFKAADFDFDFFGFDGDHYCFQIHLEALELEEAIVESERIKDSMDKLVGSINQDINSFLKVLSVTARQHIQNRVCRQLKIDAIVKALNS